MLVNNAGLLRDGVLWKLDDDARNAVIDGSLGGTFRSTRACVPYFPRRGAGRAINATSYTGLHGNAGQTAYAAAKADVIAFTKTAAAKELARFGVTANAISPNEHTRMIDSVGAEKLRELESQIALGRFATPHEIIGAVLFLASGGASYVTGVVLPVDGGISM